MSVEFIHRFYTAFQAKDAEGMAACYTPDVQFSDPVFTDLQGAHAGNMGRMLCARAKDLELTDSDRNTGGDTVTAHWEAKYTFSATQSSRVATLATSQRRPQPPASRWAASRTRVRIRSKVIRRRGARAARPRHPMPSQERPSPNDIAGAGAGGTALGPRPQAASALGDLRLGSRHAARPGPFQA
jgi:ketosteroid isomerase-like protein